VYVYAYAYEYEYEYVEGESRLLVACETTADAAHGTARARDRNLM
jgi:hypothetical protein